MNRYAIIQNGQVVNIVEYEDAPSSPPPGFTEGVIAVQSDAAEIGAQYQDGVFTGPISSQPPVVDASDLRRAAYTAEADPLFFKSQRGEATVQEWQDKVAEIKQRFPK